RRRKPKNPATLGFGRPGWLYNKRQLRTGRVSQGSVGWWWPQSPPSHAAKFLGTNDGVFTIRNKATRQQLDASSDC
ncbi:MAG: hypothetical protein AAF959_27455, partial [Cyanobacteria bacterium P01_D01_bin.56]